MIEGSRRGSVQTVQGLLVSRLPQTLQIWIFSSAVVSAEASGAMICSRFLIRNSAARRAERGPRPGKRASSWIRRSISGPATAVGMGASTTRSSFEINSAVRSRVSGNSACSRVLGTNLAALVPANAGTHNHRDFGNRPPCHIALLRRMGPRLRGDDNGESLLHTFESGTNG